MENKFFKFLKSSGIFLIGSLSSKIISFFMLKLYTSNIDAMDYGKYDMSITYLNVILAFVFFDINSTVMKFMLQKENENKKESIVKSGWTIFAIQSILFLGIYFLIHNFVAEEYHIFVFLYGLFNNIQLMYSFIARGYHKNFDFAISGILNTITFASLNVLLITAFNKDYSSLYTSSIVGYVVQIIYLECKLKLIKKMRKSQIDKTDIKKMILFMLPLCVNSVGYWLLTGINKVFINNMMGDAYNGYYAVGNKFGSLIILFTTCFNYAWQEISFSNSKEENTGKFYSIASNEYLKFLSLSFVVLLPMVSVIFPFFVDGSYSQSKEYIYLFLVISILSTYSTFIGSIFYSINKTHVILTSIIPAALLNILLCYPLIKLWGVNGANLAIVIAYIVNIFIRIIMLKKYIGFKFLWKSLSYILPLAILSIYIFINFRRIVCLLSCILFSILAILIYKKYIIKFYCEVRRKCDE